MSTKRHTFDTNEMSTLDNALMIAAERFDGHAKEWQKVVDNGGMEGFATAEAAERLVEQFQRQARDTRAMRTQLSYADFAEATYEFDDFEEMMEELNEEVA